MIIKPGNHIFNYYLHEYYFIKSHNGYFIIDTVYNILLKIYSIIIELKK